MSADRETLLALLAEAREALLCRDGGAHDEDCRSQRQIPGIRTRLCNCGHAGALVALSRIDAALAASPEAKG